MDNTMETRVHQINVLLQEAGWEPRIGVEQNHANYTFRPCLTWPSGDTKPLSYWRTPEATSGWLKTFLFGMQMGMFGMALDTPADYSVLPYPDFGY